MKELLEISELSFAYDDDNVLEDVTFKLNKKDILCIMGKNGSGKTTLFKVLSGILAAQQYKISLRGAPVSSNELKKKLMFIPNTPYLYGELTGMENIELIRNLWKAEKSSFYENINEYINKYDMRSYVDDFVENYSLGMKYKLYYIAAMSIGQDIILMDEPLNSMDAESQNKAMSDLRKYVENGDRAIVFSSHISQLISDLSSRQLLLENGKIHEMKEE